MSRQVVHIKSETAWWDLKLKEIRQYKDLFYFLIRRDLIAIYKQSVLGPLWIVIQPLVTTLVFTVVFGNFTSIGTDGLPKFLFYLTGNILWAYCIVVMTTVSNVLIMNAAVMGKVYFPRIIAPLSSVISGLMQLVVNFGMYLCFFFYFYFKGADIHPNGWVFAFPLVILQLAVVGLGIGLIFASLTAKYRDLRFALPFLTQAWMFLSPIVYPASNIKNPFYLKLFSLNPIAPIIEFNRYAFLGEGTVNIGFMMPGIIIGWILLFVGIIIFNKVERNFVDLI